MLGPVLAFQAAIAASSYAIATRLNGGPVVRAALLLSLAGVLLFAAPAFVSVCQSVLAVQALTCVYFTSAMKVGPCIISGLTKALSHCDASPSLFPIAHNSGIVHTLMQTVGTS